MRFLSKPLSVFLLAAVFFAPLAQASEYRRTTFAYTITLPNMSDESVSNFATVVEKASAATRVACEKTGAYYASFAISEIQSKGSDVAIYGSFMCSPKIDSPFDLHKIEDMFFEITGYKIKLLPPPGGGATISN